MSEPARSRPAGAGARHGSTLTRMLRPVGLLTPLGRGLVLMGLFATGLSVRLHWQEFAQLATAAFLLLALGLVWQLVPTAMDATLTLRHHRVVEGGPTPVATLEVRAGAVPMLFPKVGVPVGRRTVQLRLPVLMPYLHHTEDVPLPDLARGVHTVGPVTYEKSDPAGLISRRFETGEPIEVLVGPRVTDLSVFAGGLTNDLDGATSQQLSMSDLAFHALREYVPGDDLRHVHWRSSAKAGELLVRQYHETRRGHVTVLLDPSLASYPRAADFELAVSVATSIALRAVRDDFDTYLRCGADVARSRDPIAVTDAACRFASGADDHLQHATDAAAAVHATGVVVQVTGAARDIVDLDGAAHLFGPGAAWIVVRADSEHPAQLRDTGTLRELSVPDLVQLQELLARGMR